MPTLQMENAMSSPSSAINSNKSIIKAGAGAGKTTTLVREFIEYVLEFEKNQGRFPRIIVTTFTRKATQELKERLLARAYDLNRPDLLDYISNKSLVHISTIHGILFSFLSKYGYMISLAGDLGIKSDQELRYSKQLLLKKIIKQNEHLFPILEEYEWSQILEMVSAYFKAWMQNQELRRVSPDELKVITEKQWLTLLEQQKKVCNEIWNHCENPKWKVYIENWFTLLENCKNNPTQISELVIDFFQSSRKPSFLKNNPPFLAELHESFEDLRSELKNMAENPSYKTSTWLLHEELGELIDELGALYVTTYFDQKINDLQLSMDDLEIFSLHLAQKVPESTEAFSKEWDFWMIDEYQDTSPLQENLLNAFIKNSPAFYVGDPQQSIYLFRGAKSELFQNKIEEIQKSQGHYQELMINYRSEAPVLAFFNRFFTGLSSQFSEMSPHSGAAPILEVVDEHWANQILISDSGESDDSNFEVLTVIFRIQELISQGISPEKICILSRTHKLLTQIKELSVTYQIDTQLHGSQNYNDQREVIDLMMMNKFLLNPHDNLNFVSLMRSPWFFVSDQGIAAICQKNLQKDKSIFKSFWRQFIVNKENVQLASFDLQVLNQLEGFINQLKEIPLNTLLIKMMRESGLIDYCHSLDPSGQREANLWKYISLLSQQMRHPGFQGLKFLDLFESDLTENGSSMMTEAVPVIEPQKVNLMTIHASKGLQFDHVIIPGMSKAFQKTKTQFFTVDVQRGLWTLLIKDPDTQENIRTPLAVEILNEVQKKEDEEVQRVLYVAMTRAKKGISLIGSIPIAKNSWSSQVPLSVDPGIHEFQSCKYFVRQQRFEPILENRVHQVQPILEPRQRLSFLSEETLPVHKTSVTQSLITDVESSQVASLKTFGKIEFGIQIHKKLEKLKYLSQDEIQERINQGDFEKGIRYALSLQSPPILEILRNGEVEWGFSFIDHQVRMEGQVDLWAYMDGILYVIDYKTGSLKFLEKAFLQLELYQRAICQIKNIKPQRIQLCVLYTEKEEIKIREIQNEI